MNAATGRIIGAEAPAHPREPTGYAAARGPRWSGIALIALLHALALAALVRMDVIPLATRERPMVVINLEVAPPPPPSEPEPQQLAPKAPIEPRVTVPRALVETPAPPPPIEVTTAPPPPPQAVIVAPPAKPAAPAGPVSVTDLASRMIAADPPRYPMESRRKREQGTVSLLVVLGLDGRVASLSLARSSGFDRLDKAALDTVRRWRWSPTMRGGEAVMVKGIVDIPFVLTG